MTGFKNDTYETEICVRVQAKGNKSLYDFTLTDSVGPVIEWLTSEISRLNKIEDEIEKL